MTFVILALATWRLAYMLVHEEGPLHVFARLRWYAGATDYHGGKEDSVLSCVYCTSMYTAPVMIALSTFDAGLLIAHVFALSAVAVLLQVLHEDIAQS